MRAFRKTSASLQIEAQRWPGFLPWEDMNTASLVECKKTSPYQVGDVVPYRTDNNEVKNGLIIAMLGEYLQTRMEWVPRYRIRPQNKDGRFAKGFIYIYPGDIQRAEEISKAKTA